jgi:hypothetical protein
MGKRLAICFLCALLLGGCSHSQMRGAPDARAPQDGAATAPAGTDHDRQTGERVAAIPEAAEEPAPEHAAGGWRLRFGGGGQAFAPPAREQAPAHRGAERARPSQADMGSREARGKGSDGGILGRLKGYLTGASDSRSSAGGSDSGGGEPQPAPKRGGSIVVFPATGSERPATPYVRAGPARPATAGEAAAGSDPGTHRLRVDRLEIGPGGGSGGPDTITIKTGSEGTDRAFAPSTHGRDRSRDGQEQE